ncbi:MAG: PorP/SprF family type IX secretion system membrane protein [Tannerella sp.]|jgi:type IX secretion system PorP/SprF family membrane protein|nr:PorP/SprF family type IX secretion system membrane protein [Tannerella sp.]
MRRIVLLLLIMSGCVCTAQAQREAQFSQYHMALGYYNPATAGVSGNLDVVSLYRIQWMGWSNAPKTLYATANMPFRFMKKEHGVGVAFSKDDESGGYGSTNIGLQYAYLKKIGKGTLRAGMQLGMLNMSMGSDHTVTPVDSAGNAAGDDPAIPTSKVTSKAFDAHVGIYYHTDKWYVGVAVTHVLEPVFEEEHAYSYMPRGYNFIGGYNIRMKNPLVELQPSVLIQTNFNTTKADLVARAVYAKKYSAGLLWRINENRIVDAIAVMLGATFGKIEGGYAYDIPLSAVGRGTMGSHELFLKYKLELNKPKTGKSKHKSVRIL